MTPGIDRAGPRAHAEPVERGEAERAVDALAVLHRAQARAAAEVRDDHAAVGDLRRRPAGSTEAMYSYESPWKP